ncbi:MBL fold metallo-hydrolase [bacterium]|nr:MBL fold metallo-hydrolase [bacterium]
MEITFYGVRGTVAVPGPETNEYGGNTPCVHIRTKKEYNIIIDAGTGICGLSRKLLATPLGKGQGEISILLSHTHLDHIQGFPFFIPVFIPGNRIQVYGSHPEESDLRTILDGQLQASFSPIYGMSNFAATLEIKELDDQPLSIGGTTVTHSMMPHRGIKSTAYRIEEDGKALVYMSDVEHEDGHAGENAVQFTQSAQILIHDTHFTAEDYAKSRGSGHSSIETAIELAKRANVRQLVMFHYSPDYSDDLIRDIYRRYNDQSGLTLIPAQEGLKLIL